MEITINKTTNNLNNRTIRLTIRNHSLTNNKIDKILISLHSKIKLTFRSHNSINNKIDKIILINNLSLIKITFPNLNTINRKWLSTSHHLNSIKITMILSKITNLNNNKNIRQMILLNLLNLKH